MRICRACGDFYEGHPASRYCSSQACQDVKVAKAKAWKSAYAKTPAQKEAKRQYQQSKRGKELRRKQQSCPEFKAQKREYMRLKNLERRVEYTHNCKQCGTEFTTYRSNSKFCNKECSDLWWKGDEGRKYRSRLAKERRHIPFHRVTENIRSAINQSLNRKNITKHSPTFEILGYTGHELVAHLESQFENGMSWDNRDEWHIDHIRPISSFNFDSTEHPDFKKCWALNNLQPLWAGDNIRKNNQWDGVVNA